MLVMSKANLLLNEINKLGSNLTILELGCFCGYSAILMANNLGAQGKVISIEVNNIMPK